MFRKEGIGFFVLVCCLIFVFSGCSVMMALHGKREVDLGSLHVGQPRDEVILLLGQPAQTLTTDTGRKEIFEIQRGNSPSAGRAIGHGVMDVLTFGGWEIIGTPVEGFSSSQLQITIDFDKDDKVTKIKSGQETGGTN
ncbi:MAG: hypothetical protein Q8L26_04525 [Candidatus Omnitrophota bacterium]|nr:hypothetical protein [Candidatus Omnitrophota bacterium]